MVKGNTGIMVLGSVINRNGIIDNNEPFRCVFRKHFFCDNEHTRKFQGIERKVHKGHVFAS